ncbi:MAG: redoxin domain-containing protein [Dehalococcoidia bacterium]
MDTSQPNPEEPSTLPAWQRSAGWWFRWIGLPLLAVIVIAGAIIWLERPDEEPPRRTATDDEPLVADGGAPQEGSPAPDFVLSTLDGREVRLSDYRGNVVLLNFWATWCGPCREEMPLFEAAQQEYSDRGLVVLAVNVGEGSSTVRPFVERLALTYDIALDGNSSIARRYRARSFPTTYFIDRDGTVEGRRVGAYTRQILFGRLAQLLDE